MKNVICVISAIVIYWVLFGGPEVGSPSYGLKLLLEVMSMM